MPFLLLFFLLIAHPACAATLEIIPGTGDEPALILMRGPLRVEDIEAFRFKAASMPKAVVALESDGGSLLAGIRIGTDIRLRSFVTLVPNGARCASACAIAWLGGARRFMGEDAMVGFHAAYKTRAGELRKLARAMRCLGHT